jgi:threonine dehydrogenase-like Zn-dependent dehydrogenase
MAEVEGFVWDEVVLDNLTTRGTLGTRSWSFNPAIDVIESGDYPLERSHIHRLPLDDIERVLRLQGGVFEDEDALQVTVVPDVT